MPKRNDVDSYWMAEKLGRAKDDIYAVIQELEEAGQIRKANSLRTILYKLEGWQMKNKR